MIALDSADVSSMLYHFLVRRYPGLEEISALQTLATNPVQFKIGRQTCSRLTARKVQKQLQCISDFMLMQAQQDDPYQARDIHSCVQRSYVCHRFGCCRSSPCGCWWTRM